MATAQKVHGGSVERKTGPSTGTATVFTDRSGTVNVNVGRVVKSKSGQRSLNLIKEIRTGRAGRRGE